MPNTKLTQHTGLLPLHAYIANKIRKKGAEHQQCKDRLAIFCQILKLLHGLNDGIVDASTLSRYIETVHIPRGLFSAEFRDLLHALKSCTKQQLISGYQEYKQFLRDPDSSCVANRSLSPEQMAFVAMMNKKFPSESSLNLAPEYLNHQELSRRLQELGKQEPSLQKMEALRKLYLAFTKPHAAPLNSLTLEAQSVLKTLFAGKAFAKALNSRSTETLEPADAISTVDEHFIFIWYYSTEAQRATFYFNLITNGGFSALVDKKLGTEELLKFCLDHKEVVVSCLLEVEFRN